MSFDLYIFWIFFRKGITVKFHHFRICVTDFREGYLFNPQPHPWADTKRPILNRVNKVVGQKQGKYVNEKTITLTLPPKHYLQVVYLHSMYYLLGDMPWSRFHMLLNLKKSFSIYWWKHFIELIFHLDHGHLLRYPTTAKPCCGNNGFKKVTWFTNLSYQIGNYKNEWDKTHELHRYLITGLLSKS